MAEATVSDNKKIHFDITKHTSAECLTAINTLTNSTTTCSHLLRRQKDDFFTKITELIAKRNNACWYGSIDSPTDVALLKQTIGKGGLHLKRLTVKYGAYIIWHNRTENKFTVWANKPALISTLHALLRHINKAIVKQAELNKDVLTMEESMTVLTLPPKEQREREDDDGVEPVAKKLKATF